LCPNLGFSASFYYKRDQRSLAHSKAGVGKTKRGMCNHKNEIGQKYKRRLLKNIEANLKAFLTENL
jgi:hypothetical protein